MDDKFLYNFLPKNFITVIIMTMEKGLEEMTKI